MLSAALSNRRHSLRPPTVLDGEYESWPDSTLRSCMPCRAAFVSQKSQNTNSWRENEVPKARPCLVSLRFRLSWEPWSLPVSHPVGCHSFNTSYVYIPRKKTAIYSHLHVRLICASHTKCECEQGEQCRGVLIKALRVLHIVAPRHTRLAMTHSMQQSFDWLPESCL